MPAHRHLPARAMNNPYAEPAMTRIAITATLVSLLAISGCQDRPASAEPAGTPSATAEPDAPAASGAPAASAPGTFVQIDPATVQGTARAHCSIDRIGSVRDMKVPVPMAPGRDVVISGWIAAPGNVVPASFRIVLAGPAVLAADATAGAGRPDVARVLKAESLANSGFNARVRLADAPEGEYTVSLATGDAGSMARCETPVRIVVGGAAAP